MGEIYKITCTISNKSYIGQNTLTRSSGPFNYLKRFDEHVREAKYSKTNCRILNNAINKYGVSSFKTELIETCTFEELDDKEIYYITYFNTLYPNGYNIRTGGSKGKHCEDSRQLMRQSKLGEKNPNYGKQRTIETKKKISAAKSGEKHHFYGKQFSHEHLQNLSYSHKVDKNLPIYLVYVKPRPQYYCDEGYAVVNHPKGKNKHFTSKKMSLDEKYTLATKYLSELNEL